jgi:ribonuclease HI
MGMKKMKIKIFTDGAVKGNPGGPGGYAAILVRNKKKKIISGFDPNTTNNRMEMRAAIAGLLALKKNSTVELWTDSEYLYKGMTQWSESWKLRGWKTREGKPVANQDLWSILHGLQLNHKIDWHWVRGHNGHKWNELADEYAGQALKQGLKSIEKLSEDQVKKRKID